MGKLRLDLDALQVESFDVSRPSDARGTVNGAVIQPLYRDTGDTGGGGSGGSGDIFCISNAPCIPSDQGSCGGTCEFTCHQFNTCQVGPCQSV
jgi:hypothetical protein